jgi:hypothetical protein
MTARHANRRLRALAAAVSVIAAVSLAGCYDRNQLVAPDAVLSLTVSPSAIPADGFSTTRIVAQVNARSDSDLQVTFSATKGRVTSSQSAADSTGRVVAVLQSDTTPGMVVVSAEVKRGGTVLASRSTDVEFQVVGPGTVVRLFVSDTAVPADGASFAQVRAELNSGLTNRAVTFETTNGSFSAQDPSLRTLPLTAGEDGMARTLLYAPLEAGSGLVTAVAGGFSAAATVTFGPALPDAMALKVSPLALTASDTEFAAITAALSRSVGKVTVNTRVEFSAANDASGVAFGNFVNVRRSNSEQEASAEFIAGSGAPEGLATITAHVPGTALTEKVKIQIAPP